MYIKNIKLNNFRNYENQEINLEDKINIFYGDNAQGKTNILEAIYLCALGKSFRTKKEKELILFSKEKSSIEISYQKKDREGKNLEAGFNPKYFLDALKVIDDEEIYVDFGSNISPCVIRPIEDGDYTYMILPIRLKD